MHIDNSIRYSLSQVTAISSLLAWAYENNIDLYDRYGFDLADDSSAFIGYNDTCGNTYLYSELLPFSVYISDFSDGIKLLVSNPGNGAETIIGQCRSAYRQIVAADKIAARFNK